jgi:hypothetical protein
MIAVHAIQMAFHEISFSSIEYSLLMFPLGLTQIYAHQTREKEREKTHESDRDKEREKQLAAIL